MNEQDVGVKAKIVATGSSKELKQLNDNTQSVIKSTKDLGTAIKNAFNQTAVVGFAKSMKDIFSWMLKNTEAQGEYVESLNLLRVSFGESSDEAEKFIGKMNSVLGLDQTQLSRSLGIYRQMASSMNIASSSADMLATNLTKMQEDIASYYNISFEAAGTKLQSAMAGQSRAVRALGVDVTMAGLQQELYNRGINESVDNLNQASKSVLIYLAMESQLSNAQGDAAKTMNSLANQTKLFKDQVGILGRQLGAFLIPIVRKVIVFLNGLLMAINDILSFLLSLFGIDASSLADEFGAGFGDIGGYADDVADLSSGMDNLGSSASNAAKAAKEAQKQLRGFDKLNVIRTPSDTSTGSGGGVGGLGGIGGGVDSRLLDAMKEYNNYLDEAKNKAGQIRDAIMKWLGFTKDANGQWKFTRVRLGTIIAALVAGGGILWAASKLVKVLKNILSIGSGVKSILGIEKTSKALQKVSDTNKGTNGFQLPKYKTVLKGLAEFATIVVGLIALVEVIGLFMRIPGVKENITSGLDIIKKTFSTLLTTFVPMALFTTGIVVLGKVPIKSVLLGITSFAAIVLGLEAIIVAIGAISNKLNNSFVSGIESLKKMFNALETVFKPLGIFTAGIVIVGALPMTTTLKGMLAFAEITLGLEAMIVAIGYISRKLDESFTSGLKSLKKMFLTIQEVFEPMALFSAGIIALGFANPATILAGIIGFAEIVGGLEILLAALGALYQIDGFKKIVTEGGTALMQLGDILGGFAGSIVAGFADKATEGLAAVGTHLSEFMINAKPFFEGVSIADASALESVKTLSETILILTASDILNGLFSWLAGGTSIIDFGKDLESFAPSFVSFYNKIKGVKPDVISASANASKALAEFANNLPRSGGIWQKIAGGKSLEDFSKMLPSFGKNLKKYSDNIAGLNGAIVTESANAAKSLAEFADVLPRYGGLWQKIVGEKDLKKFGEMLPDFGKNLKKYGDNVNGLKTEVVTNSATAAQSVIELAKMIPKSGGLSGLFSGKNSIKDFGKELSSFGGSFAQYYKNIKGIDNGKVNSVTSALKSLVNAAINIKSNGVANTLSTFGKSLTNASTGLSGFFSHTKAASIGWNFGATIGANIASAIRNTSMPNISLKNNKGTKVLNYKLTAYAEGGFVDKGELFIAREAGPEMVGKMGNKATVANNRQIVDGISLGVARAMESVSNKSQNVIIQAEADTEGLMNFITFKQKRQERQYGL